MMTPGIIPKPGTPKTIFHITLNRVFPVTFIAVLFTIGTSCDGKLHEGDRSDQHQIVGGGCDGCELMYVGIPAVIASVDTSSGWHEQGQKLLVTGTVVKRDGKTPAANVILYYWQTDHRGYYSPGTGMDARARRHGHIRGWVKTGADGTYSIYTVRPAPYPGDNIPAHIHLAVKEPDIDNEYYIDELVFDDDPLLTGNKRKNLQNRGGSGILRVLVSGGMHIAEHNIVLGLHIPNYPESRPEQKRSGLEIGEDSPSFIPFHAWGPDKGTRTCPVCKYGRYHGIVYFVGNNPDWTDIKLWLAFLERESETRSNYLKAYFVYGNDEDYSPRQRRRELEQIGAELNLKRVALTFVPSLTDTESEVYLNKINQEVKNTFILYKNRSIVEKFIDLSATPEHYEMLTRTLDRSRGNYFALPEPDHK